MTATDPQLMSVDEVLPEKQQPSTFALMMRNRSVFWGGVLLLIMAAIAIIWPIFTGSPTEQNVISRLKPPSADFWFGTDFLGRDIFVRSLSAFPWRLSQR